MPNNNILQQLLQSAGGATGRGIRAVPGLIQQARGVMTPTGISPLAIEEGMKALKTFYKSAAEEAIQTQGPEVMETQLQQAMAGQQRGQQQAQQATQQQAVRKPSQAIAGQIQPPTPSQPIDVSQPIGQTLQQGQPRPPTQPAVKEEEAPVLDTLEKQQNFMQSLGNFLFQAGGVDEEGVVQPSKLLGGLIQTSSEDLLRRQQQLALTPGAVTKEKMAKFTFDVAMEDFKQNRQDQRETLKAKLKKGEFEPLKDPAVFINNLSNMIEAFDAVPLKGRFGVGTLGAVLAGTIGVGREQRAQYEYWGEMLSYNIGGFVAGQLGRGLTENERELIKKAALPKLSGGKGAFLGKIQGIIGSANSILEKEGKSTLPDAETLIETIRSGRRDLIMQHISTEPVATPAVQQRATQTLKKGSKGTAHGINFTVE